MAKEEQYGYMVFAKSIGVAVTLGAMQEHGIRPAGCVLVGTPYKWVDEKNSENKVRIPIDASLRGLGETPTLFVQAADDPAIGYEELVERVESLGLPNATYVRVERDGHAYPDIHHIAELIRGFKDSLA